MGHTHLNIKTPSFYLLLVLIFAACSKDETPDDTPSGAITRTSTVLNGIEVFTWMYQLQWLDDNAAIDELDDTPYDMMVVEPGFNFIDDPFDVNYLVSSLKEKANGDERIVLAYIDIGQAEDYRTYWLSTWVAPTDSTIGDPSFMLSLDPDGWSGNYPVSYWSTAWQDIWLAPNGIIEQLVNYGFDGVYMDWVEGYDDDNVRDAAQAEGKDPEQEMMLFIERIKNVGNSINPDFLIVPQNAPYLLDTDPTFYVSIIDALATEDTWFYGEGDEPWESPLAGDLFGGDRHDGDYSTANRIAQNKEYLDLGIPVFTVDYCISETNADQTYSNSYSNGFIPLVTRVSLTNITETPPPFE